VVIDEIQAYEPKIAAKLIIGLRMLHELGGRFAIITATMPPFLEDAIRRYRIPFEKPEPFYSDLPRHHLRYVQSDFDYEDIAKATCHGKVLVICNTVKKACQVYESLRDEAGADIRLLHSRFKQKHRRRLETDIMDFSNTPGKGIWISTQIVEASLDIDFDFLFTEMCTADSLLQRLGRCSRKRAYTAKEPNVFVHETGNGVGTVYDTEIYTRSVQMLSQYCGRLFTEPEKNAYVCAVYETKALKATKYYKEFSDQLQTLDAIPPAVFSAVQAKNKFRDIISVSVLDDETYHDLLNRGELALLSEELCSEDKRIRADARQKLQDHTISLNPQYAKVKPDLRSPIQLGSKTGAFPPIYMIQAKYDFDEETGTGLGLIMEPVEHANFL